MHDHPHFKASHSAVHAVDEDAGKKGKQPPLHQILTLFLLTAESTDPIVLQVTKHFPGELDPSKKYVFAYMPHGIYPAGALYMSFLASWRQKFPGIAPVVLTASIMHCVPVLRDFLGWTGSHMVPSFAAPTELLHGSCCPLCIGSVFTALRHELLLK
jgi:Diacylglycerol acyltransferase